MAKLANIIQLNFSEDNKNPYATILTYLTRMGQDSVNTMKTYERGIRDFFRTMRNKDIKELNEQDLIFTKKQIEAYQVALKENHKTKTVNNSMTAIRECYKKFEDDGFDVKASWFDIKGYKETDSKKYNALTHEEIIKIIELVSKTRKGKEKALLIRVAYATAFRKDSLLKLKWRDIIEINNIWYIRTIGKGNKESHKKLSDSLYSELMNHKEQSQSEHIFDISKTSVDAIIPFVKRHMDFGHRNIVFHSIKEASLNEVNIITNGDLKAIQAHGDHADVKTTLNNYIESKKLEELVVVDVDMHVPVEMFDKLSKDELVSLLKSMDRTTQIKILQKMGAM